MIKFLERKPMKNLLIQNMPDPLYRRIRLLADTNNRSLNAQIIQLLSKAVRIEKHYENQAIVLSAIKHRRFNPPQYAPSSLELLREDRGR